MLDSDSSSKNLILITNHYPFGLAEGFLDHEMTYLISSFDQVIIVTRDITSPDIRKKNGFKCHRLKPESSAGEKLLMPFLAFAQITRILRYIRDEIRIVRSTRHPRFPIILKMFHDLGTALLLAHRITKIIGVHKLRGSAVIYSYWLNNNALAATLINAQNLNIKTIARAHGVDIYESRNALNYLSFRNTLAKQLHRIFCISESGVQHLQSKTHPDYHEKITLSRLGTFLAGERPKINTDTFHVVSCSFLVPVKQIHLIIEALSTIEDLSIRWTHIGNGPLMEELESLARQKLQKPNISFSFMGLMDNSALLQFYNENDVDVFVNSSASEGIPVTMMEAQSFGIPIVAPAIGGVGEIVTPDNGRLLSPNVTPREIAFGIREILQMERSDYNRLRINAFRSWDRKYNAERNFPTFVSEILSL